ncbi:hypothetical protein N3K66_003817 [Trichothecium roseum]|uniref:Uncharacterized protein n=1 Tax=Trichothecium roseum TaxID=47278 RepID=A0ACC0V7X4_9HYPO|nr:hypothetical protein N3K66_003817 [Trichothecium roseum]
MPPRLEGLAQPEADKPVVLSDLDPAVFEAAFEWLYGDATAKKGQSVMSKAKVKAPQHLDQKTTFTTSRDKPSQTSPKKRHSVLESDSVQASNIMKENATPDKPLRPHRERRQASVYKLPTTSVMPYPDMLPLQPSMHQYQPFYTFHPLYWPHDLQQVPCETPSEATREQYNAAM